MSLVFCFEGVDGVGKGYAMRNVSNEMLRTGQEHRLTKEPGGPVALKAEWGALALIQTDKGELRMPYPYGGGVYASLRELCVNRFDIPHSAKRAVYKGDAIWNWEQVVKPTLDQGIPVLQDRCMLSGIAYGAATTRYSMHELFKFETVLCKEQWEAMRIILVIADSETRERRLAGNSVDEMDKLGAAKRDEIAAAYVQAVKTYVQSDRVLVVDSTRPEDMVRDRILKFIKSHLRDQR